MTKNKNDIQIDLSEIDPLSKLFINTTIEIADILNIRVLLSKERQVDADDDGGPCNGYFCDDEMALAVACGQPFESWFPIIVHESCHMDQWSEQNPMWDGMELSGVESGKVMDLWLGRHIEANKEQIEKFIAPTRDIELDCERRVLKKIKEYHLPLDSKLYAQRASSYIWFYNMIGITRKWYTIGREPYNIPEIVEQMPTNLDGDYSTIPTRIKNLFLKHMYPEY